MIPVEPPKISGQQLELVPFSESFIQPPYVQWLNDPELMKFSEQRHRNHTLASCREYLTNMTNQQHFFWAIIYKSTQKHIGNISAYLNRIHLTANLALMIGSTEYQKKGLGLEAWNLALSYLLDTGIRKVHAGTLSTNLPMRKIFTKSEMNIEGTLKAQCLVQGKPVDQILVAKIKDTIHV